MKCQGCMADLPLGTTVCPYCGFVQGTLPENSQYLKPGTKIAGTYLIGKVLGAGGFGVTYIGWDERLNRKIAVKEYFPTGLATRIPGQSTISAYSGEHGETFRHGLTRFREEAQILMKFAGQEGIVSVFDLIETNGTAYMVMEFVEGITLKQNIEQFGKLSEQNVLDCIIPMLLSLKFVHGAGYIHRDIAPDNIICQPDGTVKLLDFGAARYAVAQRTQSLSTVAKEGFTPFEQYQRHGDQGPWTDLYAVGATMYMALTGIKPDGAMDRLNNDTLRKPSECGADVSENVDNAVMAALSVQAKDRPQDIDTFIAMLVGDTVVPTLTKPPKKPVVPLIAGLSAAVIALGAGLGFFLTRPKAPDTVSVPGVVGMLSAEAENTLEDAELDMVIRGATLFDAEEVAKNTDAGLIPIDTVIEQDPVSGTSAEKQSIVGVALSKGKEKLFTTDPIDMTQESAETELNNEGFDNITTESVPSDEAPGSVVDMNVDANTPVDFDEPIVLTISAGSDREVSDTVVNVGDYIGRDFYDVKAELAKNDVYLVKTASVYSDTAAVNEIIDQEPAAGSEIKGGGVVYVVVSRGQEKARVPDVRYLTLEEAKQALMEKGLSWRIEYVDEPSVEEGRIAAQEIGGIDCSAPTRTSFGTKVTLKVSGTGEAETAEPIPIVLTSATDTVEVGEEITIQCLYDGDQPIVWGSSNKNLAEISGSGKTAVVKAKAFGTVSITASAGPDTCKITIYIRDSKRITKIDDYELEVGDTQELNASVPAAIRDQVTWYSSNPTAAKVEKGLVTALAPGYTTISACYKDQTAKCGVAVTPKYIRVLKSLLTTLDGARQVLTEKNVKFTLKEEYSDKYKEGVYIEKYTGYDDNDSYHFLDGSEVTLYHSLGKNEVTKVEISKYPKKMEYICKEKMNYDGLTLKITYKDGTSREEAVDLKSNTALTTMPKQKVSFKWGDYSFEFDVTVNPIEVSSVSLSTAPLKITVGLTYDKMKDSLKVLPADAHDKTVTWSSSNPSVITVDKNTGKVTAVKAGEAKVIATSNNGKKGERTVTVVDVVPNAITLSRNELFFALGDAGQSLAATVKPDNAANKSVTWSTSDSSVAAVDKDGNVTPGKIGKAVITAKTFNNFEATCTVTVSEIVPTAISINEGYECWLTKGSGKKLSAYVAPENAGNRSVTWSSDNKSAATVDASGNVTAVATGTARITAMTSNELTAVCTIHVSNPAAGISLDKKEATLKKGESVTLVCTPSPKDADALNISWSSNNKNVATVANGKVTAVGSGNAVITASSDSGLTASCSIFVKGDPALKIVSLPKTEYYIGDAVDYSNLTLSYTDEYGAAKNVYFKDVDLTSKGSTEKEGTSTVKVTYKGLSQSFDIKVKTPSITLDDFQMTDGSHIIEANTNPANVKDVVVTSSNPEIIDIQKSNGVYYAVPHGAGNVYVSATMTYNGRTYYSNTLTLTSIDLNRYEGIAIVPYDSDGENYYFTIKSDVPGATALTVNWSVYSEQDVTGNIEKTNGGLYRVRAWGDSFTVYASYTYNGKTYEDSYTVKVERHNYEFWIEAVEKESWDWRAVFTAKSDAPGFDANNVKWSIENDGTFGGWTEGDRYIVDTAGICDTGGVFTVYASYSFGGVELKAHYTVTVKAAYKSDDDTIYAHYDPVYYDYIFY